VGVAEGRATEVATKRASAYRTTKRWQGVTRFYFIYFVDSGAKSKQAQGGKERRGGQSKRKHCSTTGSKVKKDRSRAKKAITNKPKRNGKLKPRISLFIIHSQVVATKMKREEKRIESLLDVGEKGTRPWYTTFLQGYVSHSRGLLTSQSNKAKE